MGPEVAHESTHAVANEAEMLFGLERARIALRRFFEGCDEASTAGACLMPKPRMLCA
jgi:hypothetical protein